MSISNHFEKRMYAPRMGSLHGVKGPPGSRTSKSWDEVPTTYHLPERRFHKRGPTAQERWAARIAAELFILALTSAAFALALSQ